MRKRKRKRLRPFNNTPLKLPEFRVGERERNGDIFSLFPDIFYQSLTPLIIISIVWASPSEAHFLHVLLPWNPVPTKLLAAKLLWLDQAAFIAKANPAGFSVLAVNPVVLISPLPLAHWNSNNTNGEKISRCWGYSSQVSLCGARHLY